MEVTLIVPQGSRLYGTETPNSDHDFTAIYIPSAWEIVTAKGVSLKKMRFLTDGSVVEHDPSQPEGPSGPNLIEMEFISLPDFVRGMVEGSPKIIEAASYIIDKVDSLEYDDRHSISCATMTLIAGVADRIEAIDIYPTLSFAKKNLTFISDRSARLTALRELQSWTRNALTAAQPNSKGKPIPNDVRAKLYSDNAHLGKEFIARGPAGATLILGKPLTNKITWEGLLRFFQARIDAYGARVLAAQDLGFDPKSLCHGVRCVGQAKDLLLFGKVRLPLKEAETIRKVKTGEISVETAQKIMADGFAEVESLVAQIPNFGATLANARAKAHAEIPPILLGFYQRIYSKKP